jgi:hypothetical protein
MYKRLISFNNKVKLKTPSFQTLLAYNLHKPFVYLYIGYWFIYRQKSSPDEIYTSKIGKKRAHTRKNKDLVSASAILLKILYRYFHFSTFSLCTQYCSHTSIPKGNTASVAVK